MPHTGEEQCSFTTAYRPRTQPGTEISGLHVVPCLPARFELQRGVLQAMNPQTLLSRIEMNIGRSESAVLRTSNAERFMKTMWRISLITCLLSTIALAQSQPAANSGVDGKEVGGFQVEQSAEFGYRFTDVTGSQPMYDTLLNFQQGPRLLEQTLSFRSPQHTGVLFDNMLISS